MILTNSSRIFLYGSSMAKNKRFAAVAWLTGVAGVIFIFTLIHAVWYAPEDSSFAPPNMAFATTTTPGEQPVRLIIPSLGINANVQKVGLANSGNMGIPSNFTDVAWYKYGPAPGQKGSAVIDGHVDNALALPGVFKHLDSIQKGADVEIVTKDGKVLHFTVEDTQDYPYKDAPTDTVFNRNDTARLNLITCGGTWIQSARSYDHRLVVYTRFSSTDNAP